jgi:hypothetical protein
MVSMQVYWDQSLFDEKTGHTKYSDTVPLTMVNHAHKGRLHIYGT